MAPYSFANVAFASADEASIRNAREVLGVSEQAALPEVRVAYLKQAAQYHPDKNGGSKETE